MKLEVSYHTEINQKNENIITSTFLEKCLTL